MHKGDAKSIYHIKKGKTLTENPSALPVAALGRSFDCRTKSRLPQPQI